ncbi:hypothetical protein E4U60_003404 [Claviceps pazoutovae]|uniref:Uncharacterized protein n=1 Tax=Claviceps pazoutovae TaxID=1649127 RepID=A0A9P7SGJ2_9HYPO|nr:hypothetical protein E4U60_003404 [Claviceps pazoutovae]
MSLYSVESVASLRLLQLSSNSSSLGIRRHDAYIERTPPRRQRVRLLHYRLPIEGLIVGCNLLTAGARR